MKLLILASFILTISSAASSDFLPLLASSQSMTLLKECPILDFSYGFLSGSGILSTIPDLHYCVGNLTDFKSNIEQIIALFEQKTVQSIGSGIVFLGNVLANLIDDCGNTYLEGKRELDSLRKNLTDETFLIEAFQRLTKNIGTVLQDLDHSKFSHDSPLLLI